MISIEKKARSTEQAIKLCLEELNLTMEQVDVEVISNGGLFTQAHVKVTKKETVEERAVVFLDKLLEKMNLDCKSSEIVSEDGQKYINVSGKDNGIAIGYRGEVLDALQYITLLAVNRDSKEFTKISLNAESYREKRAATLTDLAIKLADKVNRTGKSVELEPMNPFERRVVHTALQDNPTVITESTGLEPNRYITIKLKNAPQGGTSSEFKKKGPSKFRSFGNAPRKSF
jgi:spoIIIJ-associated protein